VCSICAGARGRIGPDYEERCGELRIRVRDLRTLVRQPPRMACATAGSTLRRDGLSSTFWTEHEPHAAAALTAPVDATRCAMLTTAALIAAVPEAILVVDVAGTIRLANPRAEELFAYAPEALLGRSIDDLVPAALAARHARHRKTYQDEPKARPMGENLELRGRRADRTEFPIDVALGPAEVDGEQFVVAVVRDITERKLHQDELRYLSEHDALTGLLNRRGLDRQLAQAMAQARRHSVATVLLLMDLDRFKLLNDRFGHLEGDRFLCNVVQGLRERLRAGDTVARLGGDEFAIILPYTSPAAAKVVADELLEVVRDTARDATGGAIAITASIGIVPLGLPGQDVVAAVAAADGAMYDAKRAGGDAINIARAACAPGAR
jgi:diguanylate cyclase (GGDEF)-like protein/PAS domain S-box-containing protein